MTSPFTSEDLQHPITVLQKKMDEGEPVIALLAAELLQLRHQITPQAGEAVYCVPNEYSVGDHECYTHHDKPVPNADQVVLYTAPPRPVCPHIRSSKDGTSWCDLAAKPVAPVWQPIETAPRDEPFVGYFGNGEIHIVEIDSEKNECFRPMGEERWAMPTHWQPLPSPPDSPGAGDL